MAEPANRQDRNTADSLLLLTTRHRYSNEPETTLLTYRRDGDFYIVAAQNETELYKPDWYLNLKEEPLVEIEVNGTRITARAITPVGAERLRLWPMVQSLADYDPQVLPRDTTLIALLPVDY
ncbi:MAG: nitroreductase/quinone reductase family protein [Proteobacteria bacterium]|nr:nitroreductase/quinone reductase family protein [Pseudomonadota bacterium]